MDINALLSPAAADSNLVRPRSGSSNTSREVTQTPHSVPPTSSHQISPLSQPQRTDGYPFPPGGLPVPRTATHYQTSTPNSQLNTPPDPYVRPADAPAPRSVRQSSGIDTLADLASMQQPQIVNNDTSRPGHKSRNSESQTGGTLSAQLRASLINLQSNHGGSKRSVDLRSPGQSTPKAPRRDYHAAAITQAESEHIVQLSVHLEQNPHVYDSHVEYISCLHQGLLKHLDTEESGARGYELLNDLQEAFNAMAVRYALGEGLWLWRLQSLLWSSSSPEECQAFLELCEDAVREEPGSTKLWRFYAEAMTLLYNVSNEQDDVPPPEDYELGISFRWEEDADIEVAAAIFSKESLHSIWRNAADATIYNINDSHTVWNRSIEILTADLSRNPSEQEKNYIEDLYIARLKTPHRTWDETFSMFSTFISTFDKDVWESAMQQLNKYKEPMQSKWNLRSDFEEKLEAAESHGQSLDYGVFVEYLEWETSHSRKKPIFDFNLTVALFNRAMLKFGTVTKLWEDYILFLKDESLNGKREIQILPIVVRACKHCPSSGALWSEYINAAERAQMTFEEVAKIKHEATKTGLLDLYGMEEMLKIHTAWCSFLRRRAFLLESKIAEDNNVDEALDVADVGIRSALEDMNNLGKKRYDNYQGDPYYRLERIYIRFLSQSGQIDAARDVWKSLVDINANKWDFWYRYYLWEMSSWEGQNKNQSLESVRPVEATKMLRSALRRTNMDGYERVMNAFQRHIEDFEEGEELEACTIQLQKCQRAHEKRQLQEQVEYAAHHEAHAAANHAEPSEMTIDQPAAPQVLKRKHEEQQDEAETNHKKFRTQDVPAENTPLETIETAPVPALKRDRENTTIIARGLSSKTTDKQVYKFFEDCGTIKDVRLEPAETGKGLVALIEFLSTEDVETALTKNGKKLAGSNVEIVVGTGLTVYVANFPPSADETWIWDRFSVYGAITDVRFPSLKFNSARRFCYVQFKEHEAARKATEQDGVAVEGLELIAKISDPAHKQKRSGALQDGRQVYVSNVHWQATSEDLEKVFGKYGAVEKVRIPRKMDGQSRGMAFIDFADGEQANEAVKGMAGTAFKGRALVVEIAVEKPVRASAMKVEGGRSVSAVGDSTEGKDGMYVDVDVDENHNEDTSKHTHATTNGKRKPLPEEIASRTIYLLNVPDTISTHRLLEIIKPHLPQPSSDDTDGSSAVTRVALRPEHASASIELIDAASAGKLSLSIDGLEILPGRHIRVGTKDEMLALKGEKKEKEVVRGSLSNKEERARAAANASSASAAAGTGASTSSASTTQAPSKGFQPTLVRRPGQSGRRGGLGVKRGGGGLGGARAATGANAVVASDAQTQSADVNEAETGKEKGQGKGKGKSNDDFRAMLG